MREIDRRTLADELAKLAIAITEDAGVEGVFLVAVHRNGTSSELLTPPMDPKLAEKFMYSLARLWFRTQLVAFMPPRAQRGPDDRMN